MRLIFFSCCTSNTATCQHTQPFTLILPLSQLIVPCLCSDSLWIRCLTCQDVCANFVTKMEARNISQRYAIFFLVLNSVTVSPQHMENFSRPLEMMQCQEHKPFDSTKCFLNAEPSLKISSTAEDHQQHGQVTIRHE